MRSTTLYPSPNIINAFFSLLEKLTAAKSVGEIDVVVSEILLYSKQHEEVAKNSTESIFRCETLLIRTLHKLTEYRLQQLNLSTGERVSVKELLEKTDPRIVSAKDRSEIELAFQLYIYIVASIIELNDCKQPLDSVAIDEIISDILSIKQAMHRHKNMMAAIKIPVDGNVDKSVYVSLRLVNMGFLLDCDPVKTKDHFTVTIASLFVQKLLNLYNQLEPRYRLLDAKNSSKDLPDSLDKVEYRQLQDWLAVIASVMRNLNMFNFHRDRQKFLEQKTKIKEPSRLAEHTVWVMGQKVDLADYMFYYAPYSQVVLDQCGVVLQYLYFARDYHVEIPDYLQPALAYRLQCLMHQIRILEQAVQAQFSQLNDVDKIKVETSLGLLDNSLVCLLYSAHSLNPELVPITPDLRQSLNNIKALNVNNLDFTLFYGVKICLITCMLHEAKIALLLADAKDKEQRLGVFTTFALQLIDVLVAHQELLAFGASDQTVVAMARKFIIEYYLLTLLQCRGHDEMEILLNNVYLEDIINMMSGMGVEPIYRFIVVMACKYRTKYHEFDDVDASFFKKLEKQDLELLLSHLHRAMQARLTSTEAISAHLEGFVIEHGSYLLDALAGKKEFESDSLRVQAHKNLEYYIWRMADTASGFLSVFLSKSQFYKPVRFDDVKASFAVAAVPVKAQPVSKKKKSKQDGAQLANKSFFNVEDKFSTVFASHQEDLSAVIRFYEFAIKDRKKSQAIYGLLGLAECITRVSDAKEKKAIYRQLKEAESAIFDRCKQRIIWGMNVTQLNEKYRALLIASGMEKPPVIAEVVAKPAAKPVQRPVVVTASKDIFFAPVIHLQPAPKRERVPFYDMCKPVEDEKIAENLRNIVTAHCKTVAMKLHVENFTPLVQGGAVLDALFGIPHRDVDMACFATKADLLQFFSRYKDELHMRSFRFLKKANVMVIKFDPEKLDLIDTEIEILFIEEKDKFFLDTALLMLARGFGINLALYYDPIFDRLLDPLKQFHRILEMKMIDVASFFAVSLDKYFADYPERMLDTLYKMAKFKKHGIDLSISDDVLQAFINNRKSLTQYFFAKEVLISKFDKLFMQGFACESLAMLTDPRFNCVYKLFPNLNQGFFADLERACQEIDLAMAAPENHLMTQIRREELRAQFLDTVLYHSFCYNRDLAALDQAAFEEKSRNFIMASNFEVTGELITRVQTLWADRLKPKCRLG